MTVQKTPAFFGSDAWVLHAIALGEGKDGARLRDIIATGDYINHAILSAPQLRRGIAKLTSAGYLRERNGRFQLAGKAAAFRKKSMRPGEPVLRQLDEWEKFLGVESPPGPDSFPGENGRPYPSISDDMVRLAQEEYIRESKPSGAAAKARSGRS
jgi:hypothetical protein